MTMLLSPISTFGNTIVPPTSQTFLPNAAPATALFPNSATVAALATTQNPYAPAITGLSQNALISPMASYFEGLPIYLLSGANSAPIVMPKLPEVPINLASQTTQPRVDTSKHFHVFIGDLSSEVDNKLLREAFASFGEISETKVMRDFQTLKSRGYGFVTFVKREDAERAIAQMNGQLLGKRRIRTNWASRKSTISSLVGITREREKNSKERASESDHGTDQSNDDCGPPPARRRQIRNQSLDEIMSQASVINSTVYVGGISSTTTDEDLKQAFSKFGCILETRLFRQQGYAFVKFELKESAAQAILHLNNTEINGCHVRCSWGKESGGSNGNITQLNYGLGYDFAVSAGTNLQNAWSQYYQCYANPMLLQQWQSQWNQQQQLALASGLLVHQANDSQ